MKKILLVFSLVALLASCSDTKWEYKVVKVAGKEAEQMTDFGSLVYDDQATMPNKMGKEGRELLDTYTEVGTAFPNFGSISTEDDR